MAHVTPEDSVLVKIKCNYIRKNHKKLVHKDSRGRLPRAAYLKLYQQLMLPAVRLERLPNEATERCPPRDDGRAKEERGAPAEEADRVSTSFAEKRNVYDFDCDSYESEAGFATFRRRVQEPMADKCQFSGAKRASNSRHARENRRASDKSGVFRANAHHAPQSRSSKKSNTSSKTNQLKKNPYAVIYKFLKTHKYLQAKLLSTYKGASSKVAPFKIVINASSSGCKMKKVSIATNNSLPTKLHSSQVKDASLNKGSSPHSQSTTRTNQKVALSKRNASVRHVNNIHHASTDASPSLDKRTNRKKSLYEINLFGKSLTLDQKSRKHDVLTSSGQSPRGTLSGQNGTLGEIGNIDEDVIVDFRPTNGTYGLSRFQRRDEEWQRFNDARWNSVISPQKESLLGRSTPKADCDQTTFELKRKPALEVIRDLFYQTTSRLLDDVPTRDKDGECLLTGDEDSHALSEEETNDSHRFAGDLIEEDDAATSSSTRPKEADDDGDDVLAVLNQVVERVVKNVESESCSDRPTGARTETFNPTCQCQCQNACQHSENSCWCEKQSPGISEDIHQSVDGEFQGLATSESSIMDFGKRSGTGTPSTSGRCGNSQLYRDSPLSSATDWVGRGCGIFQGSDAYTSFTSVSAEETSVKETSQGSSRTRQVTNQNFDVDDVKFLLQELVTKVCECDDQAPSRSDDTNKAIETFHESDSCVTELGDTSISDVSTHNDQDHCTSEGSREKETCSDIKNSDSPDHEGELQSCVNRTIDNVDDRVDETIGATAATEVEALSEGSNCQTVEALTEKPILVDSGHTTIRSYSSNTVSGDEINKSINSILHSDTKQDMKVEDVGDAKRNCPSAIDKKSPEPVVAGRQNIEFSQSMISTNSISCDEAKRSPTDEDGPVSCFTTEADNAILDEVKILLDELSEKCVDASHSEASVLKLENNLPADPCLSQSETERNESVLESVDLNNAEARMTQSSSHGEPDSTAVQESPDDEKETDDKFRGCDEERLEIAEECHAQDRSSNSEAFGSVDLPTSQDVIEVRECGNDGVRGGEEIDSKPKDDSRLTAAGVAEGELLLPKLGSSSATELPGESNNSDDPGAMDRKHEDTVSESDVMGNSRTVVTGSQSESEEDRSEVDNGISTDCKKDESTPVEATAEEGDGNGEEDTRMGQSRHPENDENTLSGFARDENAERSLSEGNELPQTRADVNDLKTLITETDTVFNAEKEDVKSCDENAANTESAVLENRSLPCSGKATRQDSACEQWKDALNDDGLLIDVPDHEEHADSDNGHRTTAAANLRRDGDKEKQTIKRKKRKMLFSRRKNLGRSNTSTELSASEKESSQKESDAKRLKVADGSHQEEVAKTRSSARRTTATRRAMSRKRESVLCHPVSSSDQPPEDEIRISKLNERKNGEADSYSDDRLSVEFANHNWILTKYKTKLQDSENETSRQSDDNRLENSPKRMRSRKRKQDSEKMTTSCDVTTKKKPRKKRAVGVERPKNRWSVQKVLRLPSDGSDGVSNANLLESRNEIDCSDTVCNVEAKACDELDDKQLTITDNADENNDDTGEIKILEVVSLAGYIKQPPSIQNVPQEDVPLQNSNENLVTGFPAPDDRVHYNKPVDLTAQNKTKPTYPPKLARPTQDKLPVEDLQDDDAKPLDLTVKPVPETALDLSLKPDRRERSPAPERVQDSKRKTGDLSYACFNIPKPASPKVRTPESRLDGFTHMSTSIVNKTGKLKAVHLEGCLQNALEETAKRHQMTDGVSANSQTCLARNAARTGSLSGIMADVNSNRIATDMAANKITGNILPETNAPVLSQASGTIFPGNPMSATAMNTGVREVNAVADKVASASNTGSIVQTVNVFHGKNVPPNTINSVDQVVNTFPSIILPPVPVQTTDMQQPVGIGSVTTRLQPAMELPIASPDQNKTNQVNHPIQSLHVVPMPYPSVPNQTATLNGTVSHMPFSASPNVPVPGYSSGGAYPPHSKPHTVSHLPDKHVNRTDMSYPVQLTMPNGAGALSQPAAGKVNPSCFTMRQPVTQERPTSKVALYSQTTTPHGLPVQGAFAKSAEPRHRTTPAVVPQQLGDNRVVQEHGYRQQPQQQHRDLFHKEQQQQQQPPPPQRPHQQPFRPGQLGQLNSADKSLGVRGQQGSVYGSDVPFPRRKPFPANYNALASSMADNLLFSANGDSVVCTAGAQAMRLISINCDVCGSTAKFLCSNCKRVAYCSANCQFNAWRTHKTKCMVN